MGRFEDEQEDGITLVPADAKDFVSIFAGSAAGAGTSANPVQVHIAPGVYNVTGPVIFPSNITLIGGGSGSTIIKRTTNQTNILSRSSNTSDYTDSVLDFSGRDNVQIRGLKAIHSGPNLPTAVGGATGSLPVALNVSDATRVTLEDCVFQANYAGMWGLGQDSQVAKVISEPLHWIRASHCDFISGFGYGASIVQKAFFANGCRFIVDTTGNNNDGSVSLSPMAYRNWEFGLALHRGCFYMVYLPSTHVNNSAAVQVIAAITSIDTVTTAELRLSGCQAHIRVTGDITGTSGAVHATAVSVGGDNNSLQAEGCEFTYETPSGGLTDCDTVSGLLMRSNTSATLQESYLHGCNIWDKGGTGGITRKDIVYDVGTIITSASPDILQLYGSRARSIGTFGSGGSTVKASTIGIQADTISFQGASAQFAAAATASVSLPISYEASGTNYKVFCESDSNETIWVTAKTNSGFQLNSSNPASTAIIHYLVRR